MKKTLLMLAGSAAIAFTLAACAPHAAPAPQPPAPMPVATHTQPARPATNDQIVANMPAGPGKDVTARTCSGCHTLARVVERHQSRAMWQDTIQSMQDNGLEASSADLASILDYLAKNYGPAKP